PGNVREVQNRVHRAVLFASGKSITAKDLELDRSKGAAASGLSLRQAKEALEREMVKEAWEKNGGNVSRTARALGVSRPTLYDLLDRFDLKRT
ncbi:MAG: helix-turn-helix domain-containing protein, partial [Planctomycetota bacterium]